MTSAVATATPDEVAAPGETGRPMALLPLTHLVRISLYWLGLTAVDGAVSRYIQERLNYGDIVGPLEVGRATAIIALGGTLVAIAVQPTVGSMSDYAVSRWGRRKPFIVVGSLLDLVFLLGLAASNTVLALAAFVALLQFSTNIARGPFQGYVPDLVAEPQVGFASGLVGLMQSLGNVVGYGLVVFCASALIHRPELALGVVAVIEILTMASVVWRVENGPPAKPREGRSWWTIARETWGTDILRERSYVWLLASRLVFMTAGSILFTYVLTFLKQSLGLEQAESAFPNYVILAVATIATVVSVVPAARLSDRLGRKTVIYASCAFGAIGVTLGAAAAGVPLLAVGAAFYGASNGSFLAVDWALMTDIIPRASGGRYMGLSNVATGAASILGAVVGGLVIDATGEAIGEGPGPRVAFLVAALLYGVAAMLLRPVVEPRHPASAGVA